MSSVQLVFLNCDRRFYYGELADGHIFKSVKRELFSDDLSKASTDKWVSSAKGRVFELETDSGWTKVYVSDVPHCCKTSGGHVIPCFTLNRTPPITSWPYLRKRAVAPPPTKPAIRRVRRDSMDSTVVAIGIPSKI